LTQLILTEEIIVAKQQGEKILEKNTNRNSNVISIVGVKERGIIGPCPLLFKRHNSYSSFGVGAVIPRIPLCMGKKLDHRVPAAPMVVSSVDVGLIWHQHQPVMDWNGNHCDYFGCRYDTALAQGLPSLIIARLRIRLRLGLRLRLGAGRALCPKPVAE